MRRPRKPVLAVAVAAMFCVMAVGCSQGPDPWEDRPGPKVLTSFAPIYCFAASVAGEDANVKIVMTEHGPHHFNPTARDMRLVDRADLFFINGLELDNTAAMKMIKGAGNKSVVVVEATKAIPEAALREGFCNCAEEGLDHSDHAHGKFDPHVWLGIPEAIQMVNLIRDELKKQDPEHAANYDRRAAEYVAKLERLLADGKEMLKSKNERKLLSFHDALRYFARSVDLEIVDSVQASAGAEPGGKSMKELIETCTKNHVRVITSEPQYDRNSAAKQVIANLKQRGIDATMVEIDPMETARPSDVTPDLYERVMRKNFQSLAEVLK